MGGSGVGGLIFLVSVVSYISLVLNQMVLVSLLSLPCGFCAADINLASVALRYNSWGEKGTKTPAIYCPINPPHPEPGFLFGREVVKDSEGELPSDGRVLLITLEVFLLLFFL